MKTLKDFLEKNNACLDGFEFAKDLTLEQFLKTCERGDWILWLFVRLNPEFLRELTLAKGHCANTVRHLMEDERSIKAVDVAIAFGEGKATREELYAAADDACAALVAAYAQVFKAEVTAAALAAAYAADAAYAAYVAHVAAWAAATKAENQKLTADICRQYLPLKIWNQNLI